VLLPALVHSVLHAALALEVCLVSAMTRFRSKCVSRGDCQPLVRAMPKGLV
jgi:hypothetical protein